MKKQRRHRYRAPTPVHVPAAELTFLVFETASARDGGDSCAGLIGDVKISDINSLLIRTQPAHLHKLRGSDEDTTDDIERARYLRNHFEGGDSSRTSPN